MPRALTLALAVLVLVGVSEAQSSDRIEIFGGYSYVNNDFSLTSRNGMQGWNALATVNSPYHLGLTADLSGLYPGAKVYTFLFGPQVSFRLKRVTPFVHALFGNTLVHYNGYLTSDSSFSYAAGGGVDFDITRRLALRGQADLLHTNFQTFDSQGGSVPPNVARICIGIVFRFWERN